MKKFVPALPVLFISAVFFISLHLWSWAQVGTVIMAAFCILFVLALCFGWGY